jgi:thiol-disulfide isomerase/thioredoxin
MISSKYVNAALLIVGLAVAGAIYHWVDGRSAPMPTLTKLEVTPPKSLPAVAFTDQDGKALTLADFKGKLVVLDVWATWCAPCRKEFPRLDRLQAAMGGNDLQVVAVSVDLGGKKPVDKFYQDMQISALAQYLDPTGNIAKTLGLRGLPTTLLIDRNGFEVGRIEGEAAWDGAEVKALLQTLLAQG